MNYHKIYTSLIEFRVNNVPNGYTEKHHIKPRCMGGDDSRFNIVKLTAREHFIAHRLLAKMYGGKLWFALSLMSRSGVKSANGVSVNSRLYSYIKEMDSKTRSDLYSGSKNPFYGKTFTDEQLAKMRGDRDSIKGCLNPNYGVSDEDRNWLISMIHSYKPRDVDADYSLMSFINKSIGIFETVNSRGVRRRSKSTELRKLGMYYRGFNITKRDRDYSGTKNPNYGNGSAISGSKNPMYGKNHSDETKAKISAVAARKVTCPNCGKIGNVANMKRWHFSNCKELNDGN
jgi:ribosomal protein L37AE/L43A